MGACSPPKACAAPPRGVAESVPIHPYIALVMSTEPLRTIGAALAVSLCSTVPLAAADLVEPWAEGLSSLELAVAGKAGGSRRVSSVVGAGLTDRISLGLFAASEDGEETTFGALLLYSQPLGRAGELDVWCETSTEAAHGSTACGMEWSRQLRLFVPYARLTLDWDGGSDSLAHLAGIMVPVTSRLGLHLELSLEAREETGRPLRFAVGPNWVLWHRVELIPELAWTRDSEGGGSFDVALCFVMDVSARQP
jgi:hypothetical protein